MSARDRSTRLQVPGVSSVSRAFRQTKRYRDVMAIMARNGFGDLVGVIRGQRAEPSGGVSDSKLPVQTISRAARIRQVIEELGPTYVKLGQVLSTRSDLVPPDLLAELGKLQDRVVPFAFEDVARIVEFELGRPLLDVFESFDPEPLASASLGQVHRARFADCEVVVKVQRPEIRKTIDADIEFMTRMASMLERHVEGWDIHQPTRAVKEFADTLAQELDYEVEAAHLSRFARQFKGDPRVFVPGVFLDATTSRVLTMEYVEGVKVTDVDKLEAQGTNRVEVARRGFHLVLQQTLVDGFFHGDPHPGNIFILPDDVVCFIDFGMMGRLSQSVRDNFVELVYHFVDENPAQVARSVLGLTGHDRAVDVNALERDISGFIDAFMGRPLKDLDLGTLLRGILDTLAQHGLRVPSDLFLMLKAIVEIEAIAVTLDPDFDLAAEAEPFVRRIFLDRFRPGRVAKQMAETSRELASFAHDLPGLLRLMSEEIRSGGIQVAIKQRHMPEILRASDRIGNRLAFAFVLGSALVGSAVMAAAAVPPLWNGISVLGLGGFVVALGMAAWLLVSILRRGRL